MVDRCDFWDGGSIHAAVISLASPGLVGDRTVHTQSQPNSQLRRERDGSWQTSRYIPYTRISGDLDSTVEEYEKELRCKLVVSRFVSVSKLRALCQ